MSDLTEAEVREAYLLTLEAKLRYKARIDELEGQLKRAAKDRRVRAERINELEQRNENADDMLAVAIRKMGDYEARIAELEAALRKAADKLYALAGYKTGWVPFGNKRISVLQLADDLDRALGDNE
jgi:chromosome segregation ATPase